MVNVKFKHGCTECSHKDVCKYVDLFYRCTRDCADKFHSQDSEYEDLFICEFSCNNYKAANSINTKQFSTPPGLPTDIEFDPKYDNIHRK